ncbi:uncharacterized protein LOC111710984 [Eurytemora carolleeae]|uniref:uncharacterized protein LOC111710984 n=1 Tax=Eurytemora carolleeae TaxID=1294199 RepID=UPI000C7924E4|nr:uncharacterized protein LOC111710984 [Eurytemora carolleeae]|eukprot:XP_023340963.1 uncharacterized protein LOC111710984 [Eurytemora affinis]
MHWFRLANASRRKLDELIPGILQLCRIVEERGELPKSVYFPYSSFELARSTLEETKKIRKNWRGKSDERIKVESTDKEENEESEWMEQDERNYQGMEVEVKVGEFDDELEENEDEDDDDDDEEEEEDVCKTLLGNVWHMVACVTFSMCSIWDCKGDLDPVEPEYEFKDRREVEEMVEGFISQVQTIGKLMESLLKLRRCRRDLEQGWSEVTRLVPLLNTFRNNIKDDQGNWEAVTVTADQFIEYIRTEDELILESALKQLLMFLEALANLNQCIRNSNLVN